MKYVISVLSTLKIWDNQNDRLLSINNTGCEIIYIEITLHPKIRFFQANPTPKTVPNLAENQHFIGYFFNRLKDCATLAKSNLRLHKNKSVI
jgi:hypothetical protein